MNYIYGPQAMISAVDIAAYHEVINIKKTMEGKISSMLTYQ